MIRNRLMIGALACALLGTWAFAAPFTGSFTDVGGAVDALVAAPDGLSGSQKKLLKKTQKLLLKNSTSLKKDLANGLKVNKLEKKFAEDAAVTSALDTMTTGLGDAVRSRFDVVSANVDAIAPRKAADKAVKLRDQARTILDTADAALTRKSKLKGFKKANARVEAAQKHSAACCRRRTNSRRASSVARATRSPRSP